MKAGEKLIEPLAYRSPYPRIIRRGMTGRDGFAYFPHDDLIAAVNAALEVEYPLLLTGEAGCGKTDFAYAVANSMAGSDNGKDDHRLLACYVRSDSRARDLLYHFDTIHRFGDAHHGGDEGKKRAEEPRNYIQLRPLGKALISPVRRVVLIDEIDKAPRDLPNDLLRELDEGGFEIPEIADELAAGPPAKTEPGVPIDPEDPSTFRHQMRRPDGAPKPLVIITSNVERQLPDPFLRRCVFFHIPFPSTEELMQILRSRFDAGEPFLNRVIDIFETLRRVDTLTKKPATSELLVWTQVLRSLHEPAEVLRRLDGFAGGRHEEARSRDWADLPWRNLPALSCLIKLREDQARLYGSL